MAHRWQLHQLVELEEKHDNNYQYSEEEVMDYASHIGIQLPEEEYLMDLAREGINVSLPEDWKVYQAPDQELVYHNVVTGQFLEEHPLDNLFRLKVQEFRETLREEMMNSSKELSEIEEENQFGNESEVYQRMRSPLGRENLRLPITAQGIRQINEAHNHQNSKITHNSALNRNISMEQTENLSRKDFNTTKILPSSLLQNYKSLHIPTLQQYQTEFTQKERRSDEESSCNSLKEELRKEVEKIEALRQQLLEMEKQQQLKKNILSTLSRNNQRLFDKIRKKMGHKRSRKDKQ